MIEYYKFHHFCHYAIQMLAFIVNRRNASLFCQTLSMSMGAISAVAKSSTLIFSQNTFKSILDGIQSISDMSNKFHIQI